MLFESSLRPFKVKSKKIFIRIPKEVEYHKAGPIFGAAVREGFAVKYDTAAPFLGPPGGPSFGSVFVAQLLNAALDAVPQSRPPLLMNRDETAILRHVSGLRGTATSKMQVAADRAPLSARRSSTLFACLHLRRCRYPSGYLPYVLIRNEHTFAIQVLRPVGSAVGNAILGRQMEQP